MFSKTFIYTIFNSWEILVLNMILEYLKKIPLKLSGTYKIPLFFLKNYNFENSPHKMKLLFKSSLCNLTKEIIGGFHWSFQSNISGIATSVSTINTFSIRTFLVAKPN